MTKTLPRRVSWPAKLAIAAKDIKLAHSVFALPFALLGAFLAYAYSSDAIFMVPVPSGTASEPRADVSDWSEFGWMLALIVLCMVFARTFAMLANRFLDRRVDALNPRTKQRAFAAGRLGDNDAIIMLCGCVGLFALSTAAFGFFFGNWLPLLAGPLVLAWLAFYSYTKRFTALCHLVLGVALALSPIAAAGAVGGIEAVRLWPDDSSGWFARSAPVYLLAAFVACWVAGFDVIYAMQDEAFDREQGLHSIPAKLGTAGAAWASRGLHALAIVCLLLAASASDRLGLFFAIGTGLTIALLVAEHAILAIKGHKAIPLVFFTLNGVVAIILGAAGVVDVIVA